MIRLDEIYIENFKGMDKKRQLKFSQEQVTIIYGTNGTGKTTLLRILHGLLSMDNSILLSEKIKRAHITFYDLENKDDLIYLIADMNEDNENYDWTTNISSDEFSFYYQDISTILFGVNRGMTNTTFQRIRPYDINRFLNHNSLRLIDSEGASLSSLSKISEDFSNYLNQQLKNRRIREQNVKKDFFDRKHLLLDNLSMDIVEMTLLERYREEQEVISSAVQKALFETIALILDNENSNRKLYYSVPDDFVEKIHIHGENLADILKELDENEISNRIISILDDYLPQKNYVFFDPFEKKSLLATLVNNMIDEIIRVKTNINAINRLVECFNSFLSDNKWLTITDKAVTIETYETTHTLGELSSGERHLLSFLTLFIIEGQSRSVLMIDEPEISLNLDWQSKLLHLLTSLVPNAQIIVATHSPAVADYDTNLLVELSEDGDNY